MEWRKDFFEVDLNRVDSPNLGDNWQGSKGYSRQEIEGWARKLGEAQSLSRDRGLGYEDFSHMRSSTNPDERALGDTHHHFYDHGGNSHIKLSSGPVIATRWTTGYIGFMRPNRWVSAPCPPRSLRRSST